MTVKCGLRQEEIISRENDDQDRANVADQVLFVDLNANID
jgi:hypothetical protein